MEGILKLIRETVLNVAKENNVEIDKIILFGSRARGDYREDSDWDILIVTKERLDRRKYLKVYSKIIDFLYENNIQCDIVIMDKETFEKKKDVVNTIANEALIEGILI